MVHRVPQKLKAVLVGRPYKWRHLEVLDRGREVKYLAEPLERGVHGQVNEVGTGAGSRSSGTVEERAGTESRVAREAAGMGYGSGESGSGMMGSSGSEGDGKCGGKEGEDNKGEGEE